MDINLGNNQGFESGALNMDTLIGEHGHLYLNHSNWFVRQQMLQALQFWLHRGVHGFYLTNLQHIQFNSGNF